MVKRKKNHYDGSEEKTTPYFSKKFVLKGGGAYKVLYSKCDFNSVKINS